MKKVPRLRKRTGLAVARSVAQYFSSFAHSISTEHSLAIAQDFCFEKRRVLKAFFNLGATFVARETAQPTKWHSITLTRGCAVAALRK
jgi:hypothetical protein